MGALTENRKRCLAVDLRVPFPQPVFSIADEPPAKKLKRPVLPAEDCPLTPAKPEAATPASASELRRYPPPGPLPRPVHAPQRILRAFGLGSSNYRAPSLPFKRRRELEMGNLLSRFVEGNKTASSVSLRGEKREDASVRSRGSHEGLELDQYVKLVNRVQQGNSLRPVKPSITSAPSGLSDLAIVTQGPGETPNLHLVNRKVEDASKLVLESTPVREERESVKKSPLYKELYAESARRHDPRLRRLEHELELAEKKISFFDLARQEQEKKSKEDFNDIFLPLTEEEEKDVSYALNGRNSREVLVVHEVSNIVITRELLQCLSCNAWLNDEVINLYLELLKERETRDPKKFLKCHFFNTFFYKKLVSGLNGYDYKAVRRWTTKRKLGYCLIECDKIFVPIHKEIHWCLAVIDVKGKKFMYLDSLGGMDKSVLKVLAAYLMDEVKDKTENQIDTSSWKLEGVDNLPRQKNGWDCGMFMLKYIDFYSRGLSLSFDQANMIYFRKRTAMEILRRRAD